MRRARSGPDRGRGRPRGLQFHRRRDARGLPRLPAVDDQGAPRPPRRRLALRAADYDTTYLLLDSHVPGVAGGPASPSIPCRRPACRGRGSSCGRSASRHRSPTWCGVCALRCSTSLRASSRARSEGPWQDHGIHPPRQSCLTPTATSTVRGPAGLGDQPALLQLARRPAAWPIVLLICAPVWSRSSRAEIHARAPSRASRALREWGAVGRPRSRASQV